MHKIKFLSITYLTIAILASSLFLLQLQSQDKLISRQDLQNVTKVGARNTTLTPWQEMSMEESSATQLLETIPVEVQQKIDFENLPLQDTGYVAGRKISVVPISKFPSIYEGYRGITSMTDWNDKIFMTTNYGFGYVDKDDTNWNTQYYVDTRASSVYGFTWISVSKAAPNERVFMGGAGEVIAFTPPDNVAFVLDPFNSISGRLQSVYVRPLQGKSKMVAHPTEDYPYQNAVWYYNFDTSIVRKWSTPSRGCGIYDDVGSLFTLSKEDEDLNSVYALYDEKTVTGWCTNPQISHSYKILKITFDDVNPLVVASVKPIQYQTNISINGLAVNTTFTNTSFDYSLYGASLRNSQNAPFMLNLNPLNPDLQLIKAFNLGNSPIYDNFVERRINTANADYTNITAFHASNGITLITNVDESSQTPILTSLSRANSQFATPWMYATSFGGISQENKIFVGHTYLPGQFNNAMVTVLEKEKYGDVNVGLKPGLWLDGRGALTVDDQQNPLTLPNEFTIETWFKYSDVAGLNATILRRNDQQNNGIFYLYKTYDEKIRANIYNGSVYSVLTSDSTISSNAWNHVAVVFRDNTTYLYINGILEDTKPFTGSVSNSTANPWTIGASFVSTMSFPFSGMIDELRISSVARYNSNFTPQTVPFGSDSNTKLLLHFSGSLQDSSPNNYQLNPHGISEYTDNSVVPPATPTPTPSYTPTPTITPTPPLAIFLDSFTARWINRSQVRAEWVTISEIDNLGFNIWRGSTPKEPTVKLNKTMIPSCSPGGTQGCSYAYLDTLPRANTKAPSVYYYWIEDVDVNGTITRHGPVGTDGSGGP